MDPGLNALTLVAQYHQLPVDVKQIERNFATPGKPMGDVEILRAAKTLVLKTRQAESTVDTLSTAG